MVGSTVLIDPVCFLLFLPDVAYNFVYRKPKTIITRLINLLASRELYTANALFRHFWWYCNVLWFDEINCPALVVLSGKDDIVNAEKVYDYLTVSSKTKSGGHGSMGIAMQTESSNNDGSITATATATVFGAGTTLDDAAVVVASATASATAAMHAAAAAAAQASSTLGDHAAAAANHRSPRHHHRSKPTRITQLNISSGKNPTTSTIWFHDMHHAQMLFRPDLQDKVVAQMLRMEETLCL
jgi:hypothetical protein